MSERTVTTAFEKKIGDGIVSPDFRGNNRKEDDAMQQRKMNLESIFYRFHECQIITAEKTVICFIFLLT